jgi:hypothetical protein
LQVALLPAIRDCFNFSKLEVLLAEAGWHTGSSHAVIRARVVTADGVEHVLDSKTLSDTPAHENAAEIYSDTRSYRGPLPAVAVVYVELGRVGEARQLLLQIMDGTGLDEPNSAVWYVFGRIAEQYGRKQAAFSAYKRVEKDDEGEPRPNSTYVLAQRGIQRLGVAGSQVTTGAK